VGKDAAGNRIRQIQPSLDDQGKSARKPRAAAARIQIRPAAFRGVEITGLPWPSWSKRQSPEKYSPGSWKSEPIAIAEVMVMAAARYDWPNPRTETAARGAIA
jgi:hypothetical protein